MQLKLAAVIMVAMSIAINIAIVPAAAQTTNMSSNRTKGVNITSSTVKASHSSNQAAFMILVIKHLTEARHAIQNSNYTGAISLVSLSENQLSLLKEKLFGDIMTAPLPRTCDSFNPPRSCTATN